MEQITAPQLDAWLHDAASPGRVRNIRPTLLDVREAWEFATCHIEGSMSIPMNSIPARLQELDPDAPTVVICHHGMRSMQVAMYLQQQGFSNLFNLGGGVAAWAAQVDAAMPTY